MDRQTLLMIVVGIAVLNGMFSPFLGIAIPLSTVWLPEWLPREPSWVLYLSSILVSSATLLVSGVPAALFERFIEVEETGNVSMYIWMGGAVLLTLPALQTLQRL